MADLRHRWILGCILAVYLLLAIGGARTLLPWCDEAWFSSPALNLINSGYMGTSVLDPTADFRTNHIRINRYNYYSSAYRYASPLGQTSRVQPVDCPPLLGRMGISRACLRLCNSEYAFRPSERRIARNGAARHRFPVSLERLGRPQWT